MIKNKLILLLFLSSCSTVGIKTSPVNFTPANVPEPTPLSLEQVQWRVMNYKDIQDLSKTPNTKLLIYSLDQENFTKLDNNIQDMYKNILELKNIEDYYKETVNQQNQKKS